MDTSPSTGDVSALRGAPAQHIDARFWRYAGAVVLTLFAVIVVVTFISASNDYSRVERLKNNGVPTVVTVTSCIGNIGGSGSNAAGYTCQGSYRVNGVHYIETIGHLSTMTIKGTKVRAVVDPKRPSTVVLASAVATSSTSLSVYVVPSVLALLAMGLTFLFFRHHLRQRAKTRNS